MADSPSFDSKHAHRFFSAHCFNSTWKLIDKAKRTEPENEQMIQCTLASLWHWTQREDCTDMNLSIGYWLAKGITPESMPNYASTLHPPKTPSTSGTPTRPWPVLSCFQGTRNMQRKICPKPANAPNRSLILKIKNYW